MQTHLDDRQFAEVLLGGASQEVSAHLQVCAECRDEVGAFRENIGMLRSAAVEWSETRPQVALKVPARWSLSFGFLRQAAAALALLVALPSGYLLLHGSGNHTHSVQRLEAPKPAVPQLAQDNALLEAVNQELTEDVAPAMQPLMPADAARAKATGSAQ